MQKQLSQSVQIALQTVVSRVLQYLALLGTLTYCLAYPFFKQINRPWHSMEEHDPFSHYLVDGWNMATGGGIRMTNHPGVTFHELFGFIATGIRLLVGGTEMTNKQFETWLILNPDLALWISRFAGPLLFGIALLSIYFFVLHISRSWILATLGILLFALSPSYIYESVRNYPELMALFLIPIFFHRLLRYFEQTKLSDIIVLGMIAGGILAAKISLLVFTALGVLAIFIHKPDSWQKIEENAKNSKIFHGLLFILIPGLLFALSAYIFTFKQSYLLPNGQIRLKSWLLNSGILILAGVLLLLVPKLEKLRKWASIYSFYALVVVISFCFLAIPMSWKAFFTFLLNMGDITNDITQRYTNFLEHFRNFIGSPLRISALGTSIVWLILSAFRIKEIKRFTPEQLLGICLAFYFPVTLVVYSSYPLRWNYYFAVDVMSTLMLTFSLFQAIQFIPKWTHIPIYVALFVGILNFATQGLTQLARSEFYALRTTVRHLDAGKDPVQFYSPDAKTLLNFAREHTHFPFPLDGTAADRDSLMKRLSESE